MRRYPRIYPRFSTVRPEDISTGVIIADHRFSLPIMSDPRPDVTELLMAEEVIKAGGLPAIHDRLPFEDNVAIFEAARKKGLVAAGIVFGENQEINRLSQERARLLLEAGATLFVVTSNMPASMALANEVNRMLLAFGDKAAIIVKDMPNERALIDFHEATLKRTAAYILGPYAYDLGEKTVQKIIQKSPVDIIISDSLTEDDYPVNITEALVAGAKMVMLSNYLAATDEAPGEVVFDEKGKMCKHYNGKLKNYVGSATNVLEKIKKNLRDDMRLVNAKNIEELWLSAEKTDRNTE